MYFFMVIDFQKSWPTLDSIKGRKTICSINFTPNSPQIDVVSVGLVELVELVELTWVYGLYIAFIGSTMYQHLGEDMLLGCLKIFH